MILVPFSIFSGCSDFEDINENPQSVSVLATKSYYALNRSIIYAQQNPDTAERLFVINWAASARQDGEDGYGVSCGRYNDSYLSAAYNHMCYSMTYAQNAIDIAEAQIEDGSLGENELLFAYQTKAFARIWMVYLMSEFTDSFGPMPTDGFQGVNPEFKSVKDVYYYMYEELKEAIADIDVDLTPTSAQAECDPAYGYDAACWKAYGISMWMRLAMRLSEADPTKAQSEFEEAVATGDGILTNDDTFRVPEMGGWDCLTGVMSRTWDIQTVSATMANLTTNLGVSTEEILADESGAIYSSPDVTRYADKIKDAETYLGKKFEDHWEDNTDNPTQQYFFDGLPSVMDPRVFVYFFLPGDYGNRKRTGYDSYFTSLRAAQEEGMYDETGTLIDSTTIVDATYCWNGLTAGIWYDDKASYNGLVNGDMTYTYGYVGTYPALSDEYRDCGNYRVFFGPWETYFLLAEAALYGWNTGGVSAKDAYDNGVTLSLEYNNMGQHATEYLASEHYNRVGTSVSFTHTTEPTDYDISYIDGYTQAEGTTTYKYPDPDKILYAGGKLNDQLTKIITQKYIANTPWLPLENLSDHRRLGLPFWEIPASTTLLSYMSDWTLTSYQGAQKPGYFVQRMRYPSSLNNADPEGYAAAVEFLGGSDTGVTPLWWAIGGH